MNVDRVRQLLAVVPGASADEFERDLLGSWCPDAPPVPDSLRRVPVIAVRTPVTVALQGRRLRALHAGRLAWWRRSAGPNSRCDGARAAVRRIGTGLGTGDTDDAFFLTFEELLGPVPENLVEVVEFRRARHAEHDLVDLPVTFTGMPDPAPAAVPAAGQRC